jgi:hypothetical protein
MVLSSLLAHSRRSIYGQPWPRSLPLRTTITINNESEIAGSFLLTLAVCASLIGILRARRMALASRGPVEDLRADLGETRENFSRLTGRVMQLDEITAFWLRVAALAIFLTSSVEF